MMKQGLNYLLGNPIKKEFAERLFEDNRKSLFKTKVSGIESEKNVITMIAGDSACPAFHLFRLAYREDLLIEHIYYKFLIIYSKFLTDTSYILFLNFIDINKTIENQLTFDEYTTVLKMMEPYQQDLNNFYHYSNLIKNDIESIYEQLYLMHQHYRNAKNNVSRND